MRPRDGTNGERFRRARRRRHAARIDVDQRQMAATARQRERDRAADPARRSGDDGDPVAQLHGGWPAAPKRSTPSSIRL
jgi:hypothetical protein